MLNYCTGYLKPKKIVDKCKPVLKDTKKKPEEGGLVNIPGGG